MATESSDNKTCEQKKSDKTSGLASSFDQYEYVAVIAPGAALLFGLLLVWPGIFPDEASSETSLGTLGMFLIAAYIAGQILRAIGDVAERQFWKCFGGMPSEWVLYAEEAKARPLLEGAQRQTLRERATTLFKLDFEKLDLVTGEKSPVRRDKLDRWQSVTRQIYTTVRTAGKNARVDAFNRTYGMMVGITVAIAIIGAATWVQGLLIGPLWPRAAPLGALAFVLAAFTAYRAYVFGKLYARELFVNFLDATDSRP